MIKDDGSYNWVISERLQVTYLLTYFTYFPSLYAAQLAIKRLYHGYKKLKCESWQKWNQGASLRAECSVGQNSSSEMHLGRVRSKIQEREVGSSKRQWSTDKIEALVSKTDGNTNRVRYGCCCLGNDPEGSTGTPYQEKKKDSLELLGAEPYWNSVLPMASSPLWSQATWHAEMKELLLLSLGSS